MSSAKVWSCTQLPSGKVSPSTLYFVSSNMWPKTFVAKMSRYGAKGHPYLTNLDNLKSPLDSPLTLTEEEAGQ
jgi:hypothetical protein